LVHLFGLEGLLFTIGLLLLPIAILFVLVKLLPPWIDGPAEHSATPA
jgi:hypothetical protein